MITITHSEGLTVTSDQQNPLTQVLLQGLHSCLCAAHLWVSEFSHWRTAKPTVISIKITQVGL